jgi:hypothetical protein
VINAMVAELSALCDETAALLACSDPDTSLLEGYGRWRQEIFSRLYTLGEQKQQNEIALLCAMLLRLQKQDEILLQRLEAHRDQCRRELQAVAKACQIAKNSGVSLTGHLLERHI